jgi:tRNA pseudouridine38-40 synthase
VTESEQQGNTRLRVDLGYDGTGFAGWARQPGLRTVQGELETALETVFNRDGPPPRLTVAGRTDVGVHATGQVAHVDLTPAQLASLDHSHRATHGPGGLAALVRRLNGIAGPAGDLVVADAVPAPPGFEARFGALWRRYEYRVGDLIAHRDPRRRGHTAWYPGELDLSAMDDAARSLLGLHDFASFCRPRKGATTVRMLQEFAWSRDDEGVLVAQVRADAFCHNMVRSLVGACLAVGEARIGPDRPAHIRDATTRGSDFVVAPAKGLTLAEVGYPAEPELAERAEFTRARRTTFDPSTGID